MRSAVIGRMPSQRRPWEYATLHMTKGNLQMWLRIWTLRCWDYPWKSQWAHTNQESVKGISLASQKEMRLKEEENFRAWGGFNLLSLPLKMKEGATSQEMWVASGSWEQFSVDTQQENGVSVPQATEFCQHPSKHGSRLSARVSRKEGSPATPWLLSGETHAGLLNFQSER